MKENRELDKQIYKEEIKPVKEKLIYQKQLP